MFLGLIHPVVILCLASDGTFDIDAHAESAWPIFSQAIHVESAPKASAFNPVRDPRPTKKGKAEMKRTVARTIILGTVATVMAMLPSTAKAHCDTMDGPVVVEARTALKKQDITPC
jgi:hypothetical protein